MSNITRSNEETIMKMFPGTALGTITEGITRAIGKSFDEQHMKNPTHGEIKRRFEICFKWAKVLRGDLKWGVQRIADEMYFILRDTLLGKTYEPSKREVWVPSDGA